MTSDEQDAAYRFGGRAASIASLCELVAEALAQDPATSKTAEAVEGLETLTRRLSDDLITFADPNA